MKEYILIEDGTILKEGDEFHSAGEWKKIPNEIGKPYNYEIHLYYVRRLIEVKNHPYTEIFK